MDNLHIPHFTHRVSMMRGRLSSYINIYIYIYIYKYIYKYVYIYIYVTIVFHVRNVLL